jgi:hypothetical protein
LAIISTVFGLNNDRGKMIKRRFILTCVSTALALLVIVLLLFLGEKFKAPEAANVGLAPITSNASSRQPKGASDPNYTVLCVKKTDAKIRFTRTGPYVTCPPDYATVPVKLDPNLLKK